MPVLAARSGQVIPVPAEAVAWGLTNLRWRSTFASLSGVDLSNTGNSGYDWYLRTAWPHAGSNSSFWLSSAATDASLLSLSGTDLEISDFTASNGVYSIGSAIANGVSYTGQVFRPPFYIEVDWRADPTLATASDSAVPGWPVVFLVPTRFLLGSASPWLELDVAEYFGTGTGTSNNSQNIHYWAYDGGGNITDHVGTSRDFAAARNNNFNKYGCLVATPALTGGDGKVRAVYNNVNETGLDFAYNASTNSRDYTSINTSDYVVMIGGSFGQPVYIRSLTVWGLPQ